MLEADLDGIRSLGAQLRVMAGEVAQIAGPVTACVDAVLMPDDGIDDLVGRVASALETTVAKHGSAVLALADSATFCAATYEAVDEAFSARLRSLSVGLGQ